MVDQRAAFPWDSRTAWGTLDPFLEAGLMGRTHANAAFLEALLAADPFETYHFHLPGDLDVERQRRALEARWPTLHARGAFVVATRRALPHALATVPFAAFHLSDCFTHQPQLARLRNLHAPALFPVTAVTHSLSYPRHPAAALAHLWPGATPRDVTVCTSRAAVAVMQTMYDRLRAGYGLAETTHPGPALARIPLGVDAAAFTPPPAPEREALRRRLGVPDDACAVLLFGRVSLHDKMDLMPLLRALQRVIAGGVQAPGLRLLLGGAAAEGDAYLHTVRVLAANLGVEVITRLNPDEAAKRELFAAADIFVSPSDNPQETFGLTLLEAAAAGLPVIASDYDGYRDLVVHGETGWLAPTAGLAQPVQAESLASDALAPLLPDSEHHLLMAQSTAVDVASLAEALVTLIQDAALRQRMGAAGRARVLAHYTWDHIIQEYLMVWKDCWTRPIPAEQDPAAMAQLRATPHPMAPAYAQCFGHYHTDAPETLTVRRSLTGERVYRGQDFPAIHAGVAHHFPETALRPLLVMAGRPQPAETLAARLAQEHGLTPEQARRYVLWALKHDLLMRAAPSREASEPQG